MISRIIVATSDVFVRRLSPALASFVRDEREFHIIDIHRPLSELQHLIRASRPSAIITEAWPKVTEMIVKLGFPTVVANTDELYPGNVSIDVDDGKVGQAAAQFFVDAGYRHFGCVLLSAPYSNQRFDGFQSTLTARGFACQSFEHSVPETMRYMEPWQKLNFSLRKWLRLLPKPAAIFAVHDPLGNVVCEAAMEERLQMPDEIAVMGANNDELVCGLSYPPLSSVAIPWHRLGAFAGKWAQDLIEGKPAPETPLLVPPGPVVVRQSTALTAVDDPELRRALQYLRERHRDAINIQTMCGELHVSRRGIERKFASLLGSSPKETLNRIRTETAKRLLIETDLPMTHVAERSGFGDPERFSVVFRKQTGMNPSSVRKQPRPAKIPG